jgi:demethylmenaquinone methyltransferase/2-methoxy-6-polyprenyl-1,4-benzoquinol methylase
MALDLSFGRKIYDWWGNHPVMYKIISWIVALGREKSLRRKAINLMEVGKGDRVLDLACGNGVNFAMLEEKVGEHGKIIGFDYSTGMLEFASRRIELNDWTNVQLIQGDASQMALPEMSLDGAFCSLGLSAMPNHTAAIENVYKALKSGARFVVLDAKLFSGWAKMLNPIIRPVFKYTTNWDAGKDIIGALKNVFGEVKVYEFNGGSLFIAIGIKREQNG